jgi:hypothetical protein
MVFQIVPLFINNLSQFNVILIRYILVRKPTLRRLYVSLTHFIAIVIYVLRQILDLYRRIDIGILYALYFVIILYCLRFVYTINKYCLILIKNYFNWLTYKLFVSRA